MLLDPQFKKIPYLTEVGQTAIWLQARDELVAIIRLTKIKISRGISVLRWSPSYWRPSPSSPLQPKKRNLTNVLGDNLETAGYGEAQTEEEIAEAELRRYESEPGEYWTASSPFSDGKYGLSTTSI